METYYFVRRVNAGKKYFILQHMNTAQHKCTVLRPNTKEENLCLVTNFMAEFSCHLVFYEFMHSFYRIKYSIVEINKSMAQKFSGKIYQQTRANQIHIEENLCRNNL